MPKNDQRRSRSSKVTESPQTLRDSISKYRAQDRTDRALRRANRPTDHSTNESADSTSVDSDSESNQSEPVETIDEEELETETVESFNDEEPEETTNPEVPPIIMADPTSSHADEIHETTRVGLTLVRQATDELELDAKFDAQPRNQKAFLRELTERAMDCCWEAHGILSFTVGANTMNLLEDHGKIPMAVLEAAAATAKAGTTDALRRRTQRAKHMYKCLSKSVTTKVRDSLDPYMKDINQDGPMYFKYVMTEVASNPSPEAEARDIRQTLSRANLLLKIKSVKNDVKAFNLHVHAQLSKLASYTTKTKEDLDADIMATYRSIPCSAFRAEIRSMDKERRDNNWDVKRVLAEAIIKYNDVRTNEEWTMDLKDTDPPPNPLSLPAYQRDSKQPWKAKDSKEKKSKGGGKTGDKPKSWKYEPPKSGEPDTKTVKNAKGQQESRYWCANAACNRWTLSHTTDGHGTKEGGKGAPPKAENMKLQGSLKTFLAQQGTDGSKEKLSKKERKQLQALLSTMSHDDESEADGSVDVE
jgi:hypothetical protein